MKAHFAQGGSEWRSSLLYIRRAGALVEPWRDFHRSRLNNLNESLSPLILISNQQQIHQRKCTLFSLPTVTHPDSRFNVQLYISSDLPFYVSPTTAVHSFSSKQLYSLMLTIEPW